MARCAGQYATAAPWLKCCQNARRCRRQRCPYGMKPKFRLEPDLARKSARMGREGPGQADAHSSIMGLCVRSDVLAAFFSRSSCTARALSRTRMDWPMTLK